MSDERRKNLRTQGKYSDGKVQKSREKKQKNSVGSKESPEASLSKRNSEGKKSGNNPLSDESPPQLKYKENSEYTFHQFDEVKKPTEIKGSGTFILSTTDNGESKILYEPRFLYEDEGNDYYNQLLQTVNFDTRKIVIHGVEYDQPRLVAWFGPFPYSYSGVTLEAAEMPDVVLEIKNKVETYLKSKGIEDTFNSVLINLYRDGKDSVSWHSDDEIMLGVCPTIASVSLGETRRFEMKRKSQKHDDKSPSDPGCEFVVHLTHGSLVVMTGCMQEDWQHRVPKEYHDRDSRINLTFRTVFPLEKVRHLVMQRRSLVRKRKASWNGTPRSSKRTRYDDDFVSPNSDKSSRFDDVNNSSYEEARNSNYNLSSSFDSEDTSLRGKRSRSHSCAKHGKTCAKKRERESLDVRDDYSTQKRSSSSHCQKSPVSSHVSKKSRRPSVGSVIVKENKSFSLAGSSSSSDEDIDRNNENNLDKRFDSSVKDTSFSGTTTDEESSTEKE